MFEQLFRTALLDFTADQFLIEEMWEDIKSSYSSPTKHYHNLFHLDHIANELIPIKNLIQDWNTLIFSIAYHDIVYNTLRQDNEERSAELASKRLAGTGLPKSQIEKCKRQILYTKVQSASDDSDTNFFTDADLSILGFDNISYLKYVGQIRKEYKFYPDFIYKAGRKKVLMHFLGMNPIYKTNYFREKYESRARINISAELKMLS